MDADLRSRRRDDVDRRHRRRAVEPRRRLGRHRRGEQPSELVVGRRRLQVDRRRATWTRSGLRDTRHIGRIVIHPSNPDVVYVAAAATCGDRTASAASSRPSTADGRGRRVLYVDDNTGATDLVMDPQDPQTLFAAMYQRQRKAWGFNGGGPGSGIFRSRDGGAHLDAALERPAAGRQRAHRTRRLSRRSSRRLRGRRGGRPRERRLSQRRSAAIPGRPGRRSTRGRCTSARSASIRRTRARLSARIESRVLHLQRRRQDLRGRLQHDPLRGSRAVDRSRRYQSPDHRRRRRRVDLVGSRPDVAVPRQPAGRPVLRDQRRHAGSVRDLRRPAGQRPLVRAERDARCAPASRITMASTSAAATASTRGSIRPTRAPRSSNRRTAAPTASTWPRSSGRRSRPLSAGAG